MGSDMVKSKERVAEFGEVFTPENIVNEMLDLDGIKECSYDITKTFLEPACGTGNFLVKILERKLEAVAKDKNDYDIRLFIAVSTIYGVDIQQDNIKESIRRMEDIIIKTYKSDMGYDIPDELLKVIKFILKRNILHGDTLTGLKYKKRRATDKPLMVTEWVIDGLDVTMKEIEFSNLIKEANSTYNFVSREYEKVNYMDVCNAKITKDIDDIGSFL